MQALINKISVDGINSVIQNSDSEYKKENNWITDIKYTPPSEEEKELLKGTKSPEELLEFETKEIQLAVDKQREYITQVKVVALSRMDCYPLCNPSFFSRNDKEKLKKYMSEIIDNDSEEALKNEFNQVCIDKIFTVNSDYSQFPMYNTK